MTTIGDVRELLFASLQGVFRDPPPRDQVERTLVARMAMHAHVHFCRLERRFPPGMIVDGEYSRAGGDPKLDDELRQRYLDLIVHHRGQPDGNLFVAEVKRHRRPVDERRPHPDDWERLCWLTSAPAPDAPNQLRQRYRIGAAVTLDAPNQRAWVWWRWREEGACEPDLHEEWAVGNAWVGCPDDAVRLVQ